MPNDFAISQQLDLQVLSPSLLIPYLLRTLQLPVNLELFCSGTLYLLFYGLTLPDQDGSNKKCQKNF